MITVLAGCPRPRTTTPVFPRVLLAVHSASDETIEVSCEVYGGDVPAAVLTLTNVSSETVWVSDQTTPAISGDMNGLQELVLGMSVPLFYPGDGGASIALDPGEVRRAWGDFVLWDYGDPFLARCGGGWWADQPVGRISVRNPRSREVWRGQRLVWTEAVPVCGGPGAWRVCEAPDPSEPRGKTM